MTDDVTQASFDAYNDLLWSGTLDRFTKILARYELFKQVIDLPGDIVECGVFKGQGMLYWARLLEIFNPLSQKRVVGFDTFGGIPDTVRDDSDREHGSVFQRYEDVPVRLHDQAEALGLSARMILVPGDATETVDRFVEGNPGFRIALLNMDFDVYEPTKAALSALLDRMVPGGVIMFDEYAVHQWGESNAVDELLRPRGISLRSIPWAMSPTAYSVIPDSTEP